MNSHLYVAAAAALFALLQNPGVLNAQIAPGLNCTKDSRPKLEANSVKMMMREGMGDSGVLSLPATWEDFFSGMACFRGVIEHIDTGAYLGEYGYAVGEARLDIKVSEVFWGPRLDQVSVWFDGVPVPTLIGYGPNARFEQLDYIAPGTEVVFKCWIKDGCWSSSKWLLYIVGGETPVSLSDEDVDAIRTRAVQASLKHQSELAGLICIADLHRTVGYVGGVFLVKSVLRGDESLVGQQIMIYWPGLCDYFKCNDVGSNAMVVFLRRAKPEEIESTNNLLARLARDGTVPSDEVPAQSDGVPAPEYRFLEQTGSVLFPLHGGYVDYFGVPTEIPSELVRR
jgi:hypothetical protein